MPLLIAVMLGLLIGLYIAPQPRCGSSSALSDKMLEMMQLVEEQYVDPIDGDTVTDALLNAMLLSLDPHSHYLSAAELQREQESMQGNFEGIGVVLHYLGDTVYVDEVMADGPSAGSMLRPGDCILAVDGDTVSGCGMSNEEVVRRIRGPRGTQVTLTVQRHGVSHPISITIVRGRVSTPSVSFAGMLDRQTGCIRLSRFAETTADELHDALKQLIGQGMQRLVLDLRGNGGGLLDAAVAVADELLPKRTMIVYTEGAHQRRKEIRAHGRGLFETGEVVVLVDENSASASEIVAGAVQDNDRGLIYGRRTFGKGLVQRQFDLSDGSAFLLTVARYYTPSGRCIQRPYSHGSDEYYSDYLERLLEVPTTADSSALVRPLDDSTQFFTGQGRVVYGGGGICPDVLLPYRADEESQAFNRLANSGRPMRVAFEYVIRNGAALTERYADVESFIAQFSMSDLDRLLPEAKELSLQQHRRMERLMQAYIAHSLFGQEAFYMIYNTIDDDLDCILHR